MWEIDQGVSKAGLEKIATKQDLGFNPLTSLLSLRGTKTFHCYSGHLDVKGGAEGKAGPPSAVKLLLQMVAQTLALRPESHRQCMELDGQGAQRVEGQGDRKRGQARSPGDMGGPVFIFTLSVGLCVCLRAFGMVCVRF